MKLFSSKRRAAVVAAALLLLLFAVRPGASRLKSRIIASMSGSLERSVDIGSVRFHILPRPGFDLANLVVYDDPAFGVEPMLRASDVTASLRLMSLARGRIEIARLDLAEPSLNLVRGENGRWNVESLLERTAHIPLAPTGKAKSEHRLGFPYIQATAGRINLKTGREKKPYALINADFSLWRESENAWGVRLMAQPVRTDLNLNDTGMLRISGTWQRATALRDTPVNFSLEWDRPQLGQLSKFFTGNDQGWRGGGLLDVKGEGTPAKMQLSASASIRDFRRYDITSGQPLQLVALCDGVYSSNGFSFQGIDCKAPVGEGLVRLKGDFRIGHAGSYGLVLSAENVPASAMLALAQRVKKNLPDDLSGSGLLSGSVTMERNIASSVRWDGQGELAELRAASVAEKTEIGPLTIPFRFTNEQRSREIPHLKGSNTPAKTKAPNGEGPRFEFGFQVGRRMTTHGWINGGGYDISLNGAADISKTLGVARMLGVPALRTSAEGVSQLDLHVTGSWPSWNGTSVFSGPQVKGTAKLHNVRVAMRGLGGPVEIESADLQLLPSEARVERLRANAAGAFWTGALEVPRGCGRPDACELRFNLNANQIALGELADWARPRAKDPPWYRILGSSTQAGPSFFAGLRAAGRMTADRFVAQSMVATHVSGNVTLDRGKLSVTDLTAELLGGKHQGTWEADFRVKPARYTGRGSIKGLSLAELGQATKDSWISGTASGTYQFSGPAIPGAPFWPQAEGTLDFDVNDGSLPHISLAEGEGPLKIARMSGHARLREGELDFKEVKFESQDARFQLSGTYSLEHDLDFKLERVSPGATSGYVITGTLSDPRVAALPGPVQAELKADSPK